ncbi:MAG: DUF2330 domain-containing protein [Verrucomicrobiota bacterium]
MAALANSLARVRVIEEKTVAGFDAVVLAADSGKELIAWLRQRDYAFTPEAAAWAQPYLEAGWHITAMKVTKDKEARSKSEVSAAALRISFKTERPIFPYREPDSRGDAAELGIRHRLLRIYFVAESRYEGRFSPGHRWAGKTRYSQPLGKDQRAELLRHLDMPESSGPSQAWLTEFEHDWPYGKAPGDVYFSPSSDQGNYPLPNNPPIQPWRYSSGCFSPGRFSGEGKSGKGDSWKKRRGEQCDRQTSMACQPPLKIMRRLRGFWKILRARVVRSGGRARRR